MGVLWLLKHCRIPSTHRLNRMFPYSTPRLAYLADYRLGLLNVFLQTAIFVYLVWKLLAGLGYLHITEPKGIINVNIRRAAEDFLKPITGYPYCFPTKDAELCIDKNDPTKTNLKSPECTARDGQEGNASKLAVYEPSQKYIRRCEYLDGASLVYPPSQYKTIFITTRLTREYYKKDNSLGLRYGLKKQQKHYVKNDIFAAGVEFATIRIAHTLGGSYTNFMGTKQNNFLRSQRQMLGYLKGVDEKFISPCEYYERHNFKCPSKISVGCKTMKAGGLQVHSADKVPFIAVSSTCETETGLKQVSCSCNATDEETHGEMKDDILAIGTLLQMAGVSLDEASKTSKGESERFSGIILQVTIDYNNITTMTPFDISLDSFRYFITCKQVPAMEYKYLQSKTETESEKLFYNRHGVKILFEITGRTAMPDADTLIAAVVGALASTAIVGVFMNFISFNVMSGWKDGGQGRIIEKIRGQNKLIVKILKVENVPKNSLGDNNPYLVLCCNFQRKLLPVKHDTCNPVWTDENEHEFIVDAPAMPDNDLIVKLFNVQEESSNFNQDQFLGIKSINIAEIKDIEGQYLKSDGGVHKFCVGFKLSEFHDEKDAKECKVFMNLAINKANADSEAVTKNPMISSEVAKTTVMPTDKAVDDWIEETCPKTGKRYWYNPSTDESTYTQPSTGK